MIHLRQVIDFYFLRRHRLERIPMLRLGSDLGEAIALYGTPLESAPSEESAEVTQHTFSAGAYHQVVAFEWKKTIHAITYASVKSDPARDLNRVLEQYKNDSRWGVMEDGYWYQREDGLLRVWCSAIPVIGVGYIEFLRAQEAWKKARNLEGLKNLPDVTWASNDAIFELQRQFVEKESTALVEFCSRSDKIVCSPDGRAVLIIRAHHAFEVDAGFRELNVPPKPEESATQVVNFFTWNKDVASWGKAALPRDAVVEALRFEGDRCHLQIRQTTTGRILIFNGSAASMRGLCGISLGGGPLNDSELWERLEEKSEQLAADR